MNDDKVYGILAKRYFNVFRALNEQKEIATSEDPVKLLKEMIKKHYTFKGRKLTDEEIIAYEIYNIQSMMISKEYDDCKCKKDISNIYNNLLKIKLVYKKENLSLYKYNINAIYLLMKKVPPFLDDIYEKCSMVEEKLKKGGHK